MKHLKPLSMNPMMVKKIHSNQWIISKGRTDVTNDVRSFSYNERKKIMIKEEHIKRYKMSLQEYNLFRKDIIKWNKEDLFHLILERFEKDDSITLEFSQEQPPLEIHKMDISCPYIEKISKEKHLSHLSDVLETLLKILFINVYFDPRSWQHYISIQTEEMNFRKPITEEQYKKIKDWLVNRDERII